MKAAFYTLGCKVNQYETQTMSENLRRHGYQIVHHSQPADVYIVNSCTVTSVSNQKTRQAVRNFKRKNPDCIVVLCGCMSQAYPEQAKNLLQADIVIGNTDHTRLPELISDFSARGQRIIDVNKHLRGEMFEKSAITGFEDRTRAIVKIEDGCDRYCSYCEIPFARGHVRSKPLEDLRTEASELASNGYKEIVLVGINLSSYKTADGKDLADAVVCVNDIPGIERVRLGSLEPDKMSDEMLAKLASAHKFCPQFHLSLQSGCNKTLKAMNRHYDTAFFKDMCDRIRKNFQQASITTDVMVGFPGETHEDFEQTVNFCKDIGFEKVHIFPYSVREGTVAAKLPNQVDKKVKTARAAQLAKITEEIRTRYLKSQVGRTVSVLIEKRRKDGLFEGYTANYTPVRVSALLDISGQMCEVQITASDEETCYGRTV